MIRYIIKINSLVQIVLILDIIYISISFIKLVRLIYPF